MKMLAPTPLFSVASSLVLSRRGGVMVAGKIFDERFIAQCKEWNFTKFNETLNNREGHG